MIIPIVRRDGAIRRLLDFVKTVTTWHLAPSDKAWLHEIWKHQALLKNDVEENIYYRVPLYRAIYATMLLLLMQWREAPNVFGGEPEPIAWKDRGQYMADFGMGHAWETLVIYKGKLCSYSDGSL